MQTISIVVDVQGKIIKKCAEEKFFTLKVTQANLNPNPNPNPKLYSRVRVGVNSWENDNR